MTVASMAAAVTPKPHSNSLSWASPSSKAVICILCMSSPAAHGWMDDLELIFVGK